MLKDISFDLRRGEVLGLSGLVGAGRTEIARCIFGADHYDSGTIVLDGEPVVIRSPEQAVRLGIGYVPEDRKRQGLFAEMTVRDNISMSVVHQMTRAGFVDRSAVKDMVTSYRDRLQVRPPVTSRTWSAASPAATSRRSCSPSGWPCGPRSSSSTSPRAASTSAPRPRSTRSSTSWPTRACGIILISSELPEVLNMSDRILVVAEGEIVGELSREEATQERCLELASIKSTRAPRATPGREDTAWQMPA